MASGFLACQELRAIITCDISYVTIVTNHVTVHDFDVTINKNYVTKDDTDAATSM